MTETSKTQKLVSRAVLPNDFEFEKREKVGKSQINVALHAKEAIRVRAFTDAELSSLSGISVKEKQDYKEFCQRNNKFEGIFLPQLKKDAVLSISQLAELDFIQDIIESRKRLIHQKHRNVSLDQFKKRIGEFAGKNENKDVLPLIDLDARNLHERVLLRNKVEFLIESEFKEITVIFRGRKGYREVWSDILPRLAETMDEVYVLGVPTRIDGKFAPMIYAFLMGATKVAHKRNITGGGKITVRLLEQDWSLVEQQRASKGLGNYSGTDRQSIMNNIGRKDNQYYFSKWDFIVQANELANQFLIVEDLLKVPVLQKAVSHFS